MSPLMLWSEALEGGLDGCVRVAVMLVLPVFVDGDGVAPCLVFFGCWEPGVVGATEFFGGLDGEVGLAALTNSTWGVMGALACGEAPLFLGDLWAESLFLLLRADLVLLDVCCKKSLI